MACIYLDSIDKPHCEMAAILAAVGE